MNLILASSMGYPNGNFETKKKRNRNFVVQWSYFLICFDLIKVLTGIES